MSKQCHGVTRTGKRCSITSTSQLTNDSGRLAADPLRRGGDYCLFHAKPFCTKEVEERSDRQLVIILIDLETTGVDITQDRIVEMAALHVPADPRFHGSSFSTIVRVDESILEERGEAAANAQRV